MQARTQRANAVRKRVTNACQRCRQQKVKCDGQRPCRTCRQRRAVCNFDFADRKVFVAESHLRQLEERLEKYESPLGGVPPAGRALEPVGNIAGIPLPEADVDVSELPSVLVNHIETEDYGPELREASSPPTDSDWTSNPLVSRGPSYVTDVYGRLRYLGHSSTWAFSRQVLCLAHEQAYSKPLPETSMRIEGDVYGLNSRSYQVPTVDNVRGLPSLEVALFLLQTAKFHTNSLYHLFDEESFTSSLYQFYNNPQQHATQYKLWYAHYLVLMAFGKALGPSTDQDGVLAGLDLFARGIKVLPDLIHLCQDPVLASEVLCGIALYLQSIDHRTAAHVYIGQAARIALSHGMHAEIQSIDMGDHMVQRCRKLWWTIYNLDRKLSSLMGSPNLLNDQDITTPLPVFTESNATTDAFAMNVKMSRLLGHVVGTVYSIDGTVNKAFLNTTKAVLRGIADLADDLVAFSSRCFGEISRLAADLNLAYHRCIILATRPIIFYLLKLRLKSDESRNMFPLPDSVKGMIQACLDSSGQVLAILNNLSDHNLIENFLPFDLESVFSAGLVLQMVAYVHPKFLIEQDWRTSVVKVLQAMNSGGNLLARLRKAEVEELSSMFEVINSKNNATFPMTSAHQRSPSNATDHASLPSLGPPFFDGEDMDDGLSGAQILDLVDALNEEDFYGLWDQDLG